MATPRLSHSTVNDDRARRDAIVALVGTDPDVDAMLRSFAADGHTTLHEAVEPAFELLVHKKALARAVDRDLREAEVAFAADTCAEDIARMAQRFADQQFAIGVLVDVDAVIDLLAHAGARRHRDSVE